MKLGKILRKNNVAVDIISFGDSPRMNSQILQAFIGAVDKDGTSHLLRSLSLYVLLSLFLSLSRSLSLSSSLSLFFFLALALARAISLSISRFLSLSLTLSLSCTRARALSFYVSLSFSLPRSRSPSSLSPVFHPSLDVCVYINAHIY